MCTSRLVVSCVSFILLCGRIESAKDAVERPFVIFQPGDFFDPFTENGFAESQRRPSVVPQPGSFGEPPNALYANLYRPRVRTIGQISGNAQQFNAQLWKPSAFLTEFDQFSNQVSQNMAAANGRNRFLRPEVRKIDTNHQSPVVLQNQNVVRIQEANVARPPRIRNPARTQNHNPFRVPVQPPQSPAGAQVQGTGQVEVAINPVRSRVRNPAPVKSQPPSAITQIPNPIAAKLQRYNLPKINDVRGAGQDIINQALAADISALPVTLQKFYIEPNELKSPSGVKPGLSAVNKPNVASAEQTRVHVIEQPIKVLDSPSEASHVHPHSSAHSDKSSGSGNSRGTHHHKSHGDKEEKEYEVEHHHNEAGYKKHGDHDHKSHKSSEGDKHEEHHDEAGHYKKHHEGERSHKAGKFGEKKGHKRGHKTKGYHNKFHRDEYHREHRFYDDFNKEGFHEKHGHKHARYKHKEGAYKKGRNSKSGKEGDSRKKKGFSKQGHVDEQHKGFSKAGGSKKFHKHHKDYHKKKGGVGGKKYGYQKDSE